jgi:hypothetical protein
MEFNKKIKKSVRTPLKREMMIVQWFHMESYLRKMLEAHPYMMRKYRWHRLGLLKETQS